MIFKFSLNSWLSGWQFPSTRAATRAVYGQTRTLQLLEWVKTFVMQAWNQIFGAENYLTAWSLFFGCKTTPSIFSRIGATRANEDEAFFARFLEVFPEVAEHHPYPKGVTWLVFASLGGAGALELCNVAPVGARRGTAGLGRDHCSRMQPTNRIVRSRVNAS
ncbi:hypothetical protein [Cupriavidus sp. 8B]